VNEKDLIQYCLNLVAKKATHLSEADWTDQTFIELSEVIEKETGVVVGRTVLKRLYGKLKATEEYLPQKEVRNALARYAGFEGWSAFKEHYYRQLEVQRDLEEPLTQSKGKEEDQAEPVAGVEPSMEANPPESNKWVVGVVVLGVIVLTLFYWKSNPSKSMPDPNFGRNVLSMEVEDPIDTIPFTQTINFTLDPPGEDGFFINDSSLKPFSNQIEILRNEPGYGHLKLHKRGEVLLVKPFHALSKNWMCYQEVRGEKFLLSDSAFKNKGIGFFKRRQIVKSDSGQPGLNPAYLHFQHAKDFGFQGDSISLEVRMKLAEKGRKNFDFQLIMTGDSGLVNAKLFPASHPFSHEINLPDPNGSAKGELANLSLPRMKWVKIRWENKGRMSQLFFDGKRVWKGPYLGMVGQLKAIHVAIEGTSEVDYIRIFDSNGTVLEAEEF